MNENTDENRPLLWIIDSERSPLAESRDAFAYWADCVYVPWGGDFPDWEQAPDAIFFSAEIRGTAAGEFFAALVRNAGSIPLLAVARLRSLAQAVAYFRAGAADYLSLPLDEEDARERFAAAMDRAAQLAMQGVMVELEPVDQDPGEISLTLSQHNDDEQRSELPPERIPGEFPPSADAPTAAESPEPEKPEEDILAQLPSDIPTETPILNDVPLFTMAAFKNDDDGATDTSDTPAQPDNASNAADASDAVDADDEPVAVDGLPIPSLWEELPCGLLVFDSLSNLVFSNKTGLESFGFEALPELQDALENRRDSFAAYGFNQKPFPDNQWPHLLATKARAPRSAVLSIEKRDKRRVWLRIDCMPHMTDGRISRLTMTLVNLTGELPPLHAQHQTAQDAPASPQPPQPPRAKKDKGKPRGGKKR